MTERYHDRPPTRVYTDHIPEVDFARRHHEQMMRQGSEALLQALFRFFAEREGRA